MDFSEGLIHKIYSSFSGDLHFATPLFSLRTNEVDLVYGVLQILQGLSNSLFCWDQIGQRYHFKGGTYVTHLSQTSLHEILDQFIHAATCLRLVDITVNKMETSAKSPPPTLRAFGCSVYAWLKMLREIALKEEVKIKDGGTAPTLLGLTSSLSCLCSGSEYLLQIVHGAVPQVYFELDPPVPAADISVHILNHIYKKLSEICLVQGGEEGAYSMLLHIFVGSLFPYIENLDSWLFEGTLDDPFEEMFFYTNNAIAINEAEFWDKSCLPRPTRYPKLELHNATDLMSSANDMKDATGRESISLSSVAKGKQPSGRDIPICPLFIKDIAKAIISAGKSLQLIRHAPLTFSAASGNIPEFGRGITGLTLSELFCVSLAALVGFNDHISDYFVQDEDIVSSAEKQNQGGKGKNFPAITHSEEWYKFLSHALFRKKESDCKPSHKYTTEFLNEEISIASDQMHDLQPVSRSFCPENPSLTVCQPILQENEEAWCELNVSKTFPLPPLNDESLRVAVFGRNSDPGLEAKGTNYMLGFPFGESENLHIQTDIKMLEVLFPFPTLLPSFQDDLHISEVFPFQRNSTLPSRVLNWIQSAELQSTPIPVVIVHECLTVYIRKQIDYIGRHMMTKLLYEWRLMHELEVLRAIYLLGSGDLLQHFLTVIFNKLDKGEFWDDDFELNTILQESIRNSADGILLNAPDSLVVSVNKSYGFGVDEQQNTSNFIPHQSHGKNFGIDGLDSLKFIYKVSWPLELIANKDAIKKYNQVMSFLLKVKRAKFSLDKTRRWMWKDRGTATINRKRHWLLEQKLLHFVDAFHQYVMDRVYHSEWRELCEGMAAAASLDEVIEAHEAYLLSVQRQCFVVPDKLWALIASRINSILGLSLDFYAIQQTRRSSGTVSAIKARCEMEVDRIERQFDDCIAFLLRVLSFKLNVGQFPHLADLVTRINYNNYYMSDSGNLISAPVSDGVTSKLGKAFVARAD